MKIDEIDGLVLGWVGVALKKIPVKVPLSRRVKLGELNQLTAVGSINCGRNGQREVRAAVGLGRDGLDGALSDAR
jgi:hypothetical protein